MQNRYWMKSIALACALWVMPHAEDSAWVSLIPTGTALTGWVPRFEGKAVGVNPDTTFRMSPEGYLWVNLHTSFSNTGFGHLYYTKEKFSYYLVRAEYKFTKDKSEAGFATWTNQNNGLMIHSPEPETVTGSFPNSIEVQLLGPKNTNEDRIPSSTWPVGLTGNMCIAGDAFVVNYKGNNNYTNHCTTVTYPNAWKGTQIPWDKEFSDITVRVLGDSLIQHIIRGQVVMEESNIRNKTTGKPVNEGYLSIQAEGTATQFKKLEVLSLIGCMDKTSPAYRSYFVKNLASACTAVTPTRQTLSPKKSFRFTQSNHQLVWRTDELVSVELFQLNGSRLGRETRNAQGEIRFSVAKPGIYWGSFTTAQGVYHQAVQFIP